MYNVELVVHIDPILLNDELLSVTYTYNGNEKTVELNRLFALESSLFNVSRGDTIKVEVLRGGIEVELSISVNSVTSVS
mgnify:CR=1 FL=1